jgi:hypothetical protein
MSGQVLNKWWRVGSSRGAIYEVGIRIQGLSCANGRTMRVDSGFTTIEIHRGGSLEQVFHLARRTNQIFLLLNS